MTTTADRRGVATLEGQLSIASIVASIVGVLAPLPMALQITLIAAAAVVTSVFVWSRRGVKTALAQATTTVVANPSQLSAVADALDQLVGIVRTIQGGQQGSG